MKDVFTRITVDPKICSGQPCVRGLRIPVSVVLKHLASGKSAAQIVQELPDLEEPDVADCLRFAAWLASGKTIDAPPAA